MNKLLDNKIFLIGVIFLFTFNMSLIYILQNAWMNSVSNFLPIVKHTHTLKYEIASVHLWTEEYFMNDLHIDLETEIKQREKKIDISKAIIEKKLIKTKLSIKLLENFITIKKNMKDFNTLTALRLKTNIEDINWHKIHAVFDSKYIVIQNSLSMFEKELSLLIQKERKKRNFFFTLTIVFFIVFNTITFLIFYIIRKKNLIFHKELLEQKKAFEMIFQKSTDGVMLLKNNVVYDCNESLLKMFSAKAKDELINLHISSLSPQIQPNGENSFSKAHEMIALCIKNTNHNFQWLHKSLDGETFMTEVLLTYISLHGEGIIHVVIRDISQRLKLENEYKENQRAMFQQSKMAQMGTMMSNIAHQWKQPLAQINSKLIELSSAVPLKEKEQEIIDNKIERIEELTDYMANTIENFRTYFSPTKEKTYFFISSTLEKSLSLTGDDSTNIQLTIECDKSLKLYGFEDELLQVIIILINNAKEAFNGRGVVKPFIQIIVQKTTETKLMISVIDNAGGIDDKIIDEIFTPYFSTKKNSKNSGIGLYMAKTILQNSMNAKLYYEKIEKESHFNILIDRISIND
jgi:signal transduction histidine kinase